MDQIDWKGINGPMCTEPN